MNLTPEQAAAAHAMGQKMGKQAVHGKMFKIENKGVKIQTIWGEDQADVELHLNKIRQPFTKVLPLH